MPRSVLTACLAVLLAGCVDVTPVARPDGRQMYTIDCDGESSGCFDKAGELCPAGYYLVERKSGSTELPYTAGVIAAPHTRILIECK